MDAEQTENEISLWFPCEEITPVEENPNGFLEFNNFTQEITSDPYFEPWNREDMLGEWHLQNLCISTTQDDFGILNSDSGNETSKSFSSSSTGFENWIYGESAQNCDFEIVQSCGVVDKNVQSSGSQDETIQSCGFKDETVLSCGVKDETVQSCGVKDETVQPYGFKDENINCFDISNVECEIFPFENDCERMSTCASVTSVAINEDASSNLNEKECPSETSTSKQPISPSSSTDSCQFAIWALKSLLPEQQELDDKGSVLHATADYIEKLRAEIGVSLKGLGIAETVFWSELESIFYMKREQPDNKIYPEQEESKEVKRPPNAFIRFSVAFRKMVANDFPNRSNREISQMLGAIWRRMRREEKQPFIREFYAELEQTRRDHPEWNYAGKNTRRFQVDLNDVQPERLRPRKSEQNINYRNMYGKLPAKGKKRKLEIENWVQCDLCNKWRKLPISFTEKLPEKWTCSMNPDQNMNNCDKDEEI